ncbi:MAG: ABC transporter substrate-binding protein [Comamonadaceae bacterium]|nr:MAG: ABC transporter substrate-binding protein [Comamonadaceae bacterium]
MKSTNTRPTGSPVDPGPAARELVAAVATAANTHHDEIVRLIIDRLFSEIAGVAADQRLVDLATAGADASVTANVQMLKHDIDVEWMTVPGALREYARVVAQRGFPAAVLEQGSRLTRNVVLRWCLEQLGPLGDDPVVVAQAAVDLMSQLTGWGDNLYQQLLEIHEATFESWLRNRSAARSARIDDLLEGRQVEVGEVETTLAYNLDQWHLGVILWTGRSAGSDDLARIEGVVNALSKHLGCQGRPLFEPRDERTAWAWLPVGARRPVNLSEVAASIASRDDSVTVALGAAHHGREGFVRTHQQAAQAAVVARASRVSGLHAVPMEEVGAVALMCSNLELTHMWVNDVLGPLAADDPTIALYRETLRVFLSSGGSYTTAALSLNMHKNSVMYRLRKIEGLLGRSVRERRLDLENALALCDWLGPAVLHSNITVD